MDQLTYSSHLYILTPSPRQSPRSRDDRSSPSRRGTSTKSPKGQTNAESDELAATLFGTTEAGDTIEATPKPRKSKKKGGHDGAEEADDEKYDDEGQEASNSARTEKKRLSKAPRPRRDDDDDEL